MWHEYMVYVVKEVKLTLVYFAVDTWIYSRMGLYVILNSFEQ